MIRMPIRMRYTAETSIVKKKSKNVLIILMVFFVFASLFLIQIQFLINRPVRTFKISTFSMEPSLLLGDYVIANKYSYNMYVPFTKVVIFSTGALKRGDVIFFKYPNNHAMDFIKRVIGLPGDRLQIINKQVYIDGKTLHEPYVQHEDPAVLPAKESPRDNYGPVVVPTGEYFVMGDNGASLGVSP